MASNPSLQVEDQTDEDFFDKLVDDDEEFKVTGTFGNDSDEVKVFANLSVGEVAAGSEDLGGEGRTDDKGEATHGGVNAASEDGHVEESTSLVSSNSFGLDSVIEPTGDSTGTEVTSDSTISKINESSGSGIREVQWTAFNTDSQQNDSGGFGSYSDLFSELGNGAVDPLGKVEDNLCTESKIGSGSEELETTYSGSNYNRIQYQENQAYEAAVGQSVDGQDLSSSEYWENLYPGWKYDTNTGQWYQVDGYDATTNVQGCLDSNLTSGWAVSDGNSQVSYLQQTPQSFEGSATESGITENVSNWNQLSHESGGTDSVSDWNRVSQQSGGAESVSNWNQISQGNNGYPANMVFDPQYPGWYYDTIAQEWHSLESYTSLVQPTIQSDDNLNQNGFTSTATFSHENDQKTYGDNGQMDNYRTQGFGVQGNQASSVSNYYQQGWNLWQPENVAKNEAPVDFGNPQLDNNYGSNFSMNNHVSQQKSYGSGGTGPFYEKATQGYNDFATTGSQGFLPSGNFSQQVNQPSMQQNEQLHVSNNYYHNQNSASFSQHQFSVDPNVGRSSAGRPPHALVTFGFGGKLIVTKDSSPFSSSSYEGQGPLGGSISVLNLTEIVTEKIDWSSMGVGAFDYFNTLCRQSFPGPLVGGNAGNKELNKWIDDRIANCESPDMDYRKGEALKLLLSLLKIACQYYGKLRSSFGADSVLKETDVPESAVARLFASVKRSGPQFSDYGAFTHCLQKLPSEGQMQATAAEVQSLLVSGRKKEALHCASEGQLWGTALVLAAQLGDQFYVDTVKQMALRQLVAGSPLRTLCLLIAGQPADVFSIGSPSDSGIPGAINMSLQTGQCGTNGMLDDWEENLAAITANRTKDDELVLIHLGDCLWKERSEIIAAHICYLVAEANFEAYSDTARMCLIGADHWKYPRTYASPDAIQRTELYEYSKVLGNPQFLLLPFQPYKIIYANMLAEVGKVTESLKYCQAVLKSLKTGRAPEMDTWRQLFSSLEERLRTHQQGGFSTNLAPAKLVGKLLNLFDSTAHRVVGGLPPPAPSTSHGSALAIEHHYQTSGPKVSTSQSTMAMSSLMASASMEPISEWTTDNRMTIQNRSVSEPDFRTPKQDHLDSSKESTSSSTQNKVSRFGRFGFGSQLLQKTVGLVLKPRQDRQAKLGEKNKFYYDENLKRWVEEGAEAPAEEVALPPPPTTAAFQNGMSDYNLKSALKIESSPDNRSPDFKSPTPLEHSSGIPPIPPASNQFSARGRMGVRSRYVDTFNKGGGNSSNLFQSPSIPSIKPPSGASPNFFVPTPVSSTEQIFDPTADSTQETTESNDKTLIPTTLHSTTQPSSVTMQRFPSMDQISNKGTMTNGNGSHLSSSRRAASWSGSLSGAHSPPERTELKPLGEVLGMPPTTYMLSETSSEHSQTNIGSFGDVRSQTNGGGFGDELHEVEL